MIPVRQPESTAEIGGILNAYGPLDVAVVVAYGMILDADARNAPRAGILNLHFSLLPRWRGAAPVARALLAGDSMTGVTIIRIDEGLDSGDVLTAQAVDIEEGESRGALTSRLARIGAHLMAGVIEPYLAGQLEPVPQSLDGLTYAHKITAEDRPLSVELTGNEFVNMVRGLSPSPGATLEIDGRVHKILKARRSTILPSKGSWFGMDDVPVVGVADGGVELLEIQPPGRTPMSGGAWLRGRMQTHGSVA
jgi:methionyl-tRNA formyltransferase